MNHFEPSSQSPSDQAQGSSGPAAQPAPANTVDAGCGCTGGSAATGSPAERVGPASGNGRGNDLPDGPRSDTRQVQGGGGDARQEAEQAGKQQAG